MLPNKSGSCGTDTLPSSLSASEIFARPALESPVPNGKDRSGDAEVGRFVARLSCGDALKKVCIIVRVYDVSQSFLKAQQNHAFDSRHECTSFSRRLRRTSRTGDAMGVRSLLAGEGERSPEPKAGERCPKADCDLRPDDMSRPTRPSPVSVASREIQLVKNSWSD